MHNAGHMVYGPSEAFTAEQLAQLYDTNVLSTQRLNRAVLPHMRQAGRGLVLWNSSTSVAGGTPPWLGPYFADSAGRDIGGQFVRRAVRESLPQVSEERGYAGTQ